MVSPADQPEDQRCYPAQGGKGGGLLPFHLMATRKTSRTFETAEKVRRIFRLYASGMGPEQIAPGEAIWPVEKETAGQVKGTGTG